MQHASLSSLRIVHVEDDPDAREDVLRGLAEAGIQAQGYASATELYRGLLREPCDILILDVGLPDEDGFSVAARLRLQQRERLGVIMLTGLAELDSRVQGLQSGADAYLVKPVAMRELLATLQSLARRMGLIAGEDRGCTAWHVDSSGWLLLTPNGARVELTQAERDFLHVLMVNPEQTVSREQIICGMGHNPEYYSDHRLDMVISRLRRKVREVSGLKLPLKAVRGIGFALLCHRNEDIST